MWIGWVDDMKHRIEDMARNLSVRVQQEVAAIAEEMRMHQRKQAMLRRRITTIITNAREEQLDEHRNNNS